MIEPLRIELLPIAADEIRSLGPVAAARIEAKLRIIRAAGWEAARAGEMIRDLGSLEKGIHEIRVTGRGEAYRLLCFATGDRTGRIVVLASCIRKSRLLGHRRLSQHVRRAAARRDEWLGRRTGEDTG